MQIMRADGELQQPIALAGTGLLLTGRSHRPRPTWPNQARLAFLTVTHRYKRTHCLWLEQFQIADSARVANRLNWLSRGAISANSALGTAQWAVLGLMLSLWSATAAQRRIGAPAHKGDEGAGCCWWGGGEEQAALAASRRRLRFER